MSPTSTPENIALDGPTQYTPAHCPAIGSAPAFTTPLPPLCYPPSPYVLDCQYSPSSSASSPPSSASPSSTAPSSPPSPPSPTSSPSPSATRSRSARSRHDPNHIPRPANAFVIFRSQYKIDKTIEHDHRHVSRMAGWTWKNMTAAEKKPYQDEAKTRKAEHAIKYPGYRFKPQTRRVKMKRNANRRSPEDIKASLELAAILARTDVPLEARHAEALKVKNRQAQVKQVPVPQQVAASWPSSSKNDSVPPFQNPLLDPSCSPKTATPSSTHDASPPSLSVNANLAAHTPFVTEGFTSPVPFSSALPLGSQELYLPSPPPLPTEFISAYNTMSTFVAQNAMYGTNFSNQLYQLSFSEPCFNPPPALELELPTLFPISDGYGSTIFGGGLQFPFLSSDISPSEVPFDEWIIDPPVC